MEETIESPRPQSVRVRLARIAEEVIALDSAVNPSAGRGRWLTFDRDHRIVGVIAIENAGAKVDLQLHLDLVWPPPPIERVTSLLRTDIVERAGREQLEGRLGQVDVTYHDLLLPNRDDGEEDR